MRDDLDPRWVDSRDRPGREREIDSRERSRRDPRDAFTDGLDLPRGREREDVSLGDETFRLRGSEVRALATNGAFRVVPVDDIRNDDGRSADLWHGDLERLRADGLIREVAPLDREDRTVIVTLTDKGRDLLEAHRDPRDEHRRLAPVRLCAYPSSPCICRGAAARSSAGAGSPTSRGRARSRVHASPTNADTR